MVDGYWRDRAGRLHLVRGLVAYEVGTRGLHCIDSQGRMWGGIYGETSWDLVLRVTDHG